MGLFQGLPALFSKTCEGNGSVRAIDGGLTCAPYVLLRKKYGNSNPARWITTFYDELCRVKAKRERKAFTQAYFSDLKNVMHRIRIIERHSEEGLRMHEENNNQYQHLKKVISLNKQLSSVPNYNFEISLDSAGTFFEKAENVAQRESAVQE